MIAVTKKSAAKDVLLRRIPFFWLLLLCLLSTGPVRAALVGPVRPVAGSFTVGIESSLEKRRLYWPAWPADRYALENIRTLARVGYGISDRMDVHLRLGVADLDIDDGADVYFGQDVTINGTPRTAWGLGLSGILYDADAWNLAGHADYLTHNGHDGISHPGSVRNLTYDVEEWSLGLQAQWRFQRLRPYAGVKYSEVRFRLRRWVGGAMDGRAESEKNFGLVVGSALDFAPQWSCFFEGRFLDETAFGGGIRRDF